MAARSRPTWTGDLFDGIGPLTGVDVGPSRISVPGARGFSLREGSADEQEFLVPQFAELAYLHMRAGTRLPPGFTLI